ncbi:von Willebrand factor type A domain protein [Rubripirellula lacrimiformis]|uniref:von Willebrand factor type A domain protein n=1 Tax=Rubripirellula lacrimiformis TaxID=1930273 RepID=A0A517N6G9_9BACT|nr:VWA domain-containing protein [Rubripirellula lacrimiformis]QDT02598.1 von Willebrand factor type A domain protein [Rubripirellula lacrimiformis]
MSVLQWTQPQWAWLWIPAIIWLVGFHLRTLSDFSPRQRMVSLLIRIVVVTLLIAAICGPVWLRQTDRKMIVFAVDQSESIDQAARDAANRFLEQAAEQADADGADVRFLAFDRTPGRLQSQWTPEDTSEDSEPTAGDDSIAVDVADDPDAADDPDVDAASPTDAESAQIPSEDAPATPANVDPPGADSTKRLGTDLAAAIRTAVASIPPSRVPRIVLLSDGNATNGGDALAAADSGVPIWTVPLPVRSDPEVQMAGVEAPTQVRQGQPFFVEVIVNSNRETEGHVDLYRGDIQIGDADSPKVKIKKGENRFRFQQTVLGQRQETFAARLRQFDDTLLDNNEASTIVYASGKPRVLLIDIDPDETDSLRWALDEQAIDVDVRPPEGIPSQLSELQGYECLILSNVPATAMTMRQMDLIRIYVQDLGGGLIMLGGDQSFGLGGYYRTQIEEILPVRSNFEKEREKPSLAMMLVIDKSGSMGGQKIELAKDAAQAAVELLGPKDSLGVIAFDGGSYTISELRSVSDRGAITDAISTIEASGGTNMYPAMIDAYDALVAATAKLKHVILMTDGVSTPGDFQGAAQDMSSSRITLSTVALGQGSSEDLLEELAQIGGGRYYFCDDPQSVPQVFAKETVEASKSAINELPFLPQLVRPTSVLDGIEWDLSPLLLGYVVTRPKPTAEFILASESGDPLLVWWRYGLGMSVAFTSDAKNRWAGEWLSWPDFGTFWAQIIRHAMRKDDNRGVFVEVQRDGDRTRIVMDAIDDNGRFIDEAESRLTVIDPRLKNEKIAMQQTAPGRFEAAVETPRRGAYHFDIAQNRSDGTTQRSSRGVTIGYPDELRLLPLGEPALRQIAAVSGGYYDRPASAVTEDDERTARDPVPMWPWLLMAGLAIFVADVAFRRIEIGNR